MTPLYAILVVPTDRLNKIEALLTKHEFYPTIRNHHPTWVDDNGTHSDETKTRLEIDTAWGLSDRMLYKIATVLKGGTDETFYYGGKFGTLNIVSCHDERFEEFIPWPEKGEFHGHL